MPIYEYQCQQCGHAFEITQKMSDAPLATCPQCGKKSLEKLVSMGSFHLKGSGWYATDYGKKTTTPKTESSSDTKAPAKETTTTSSESTKTETKSETK